jgi:superoxide dismutase, Fe-Mn family
VFFLTLCLVDQLFGSGYTWLVADSTKALFIVNTANQDLPAPQYTPLLVVDVVRLRGPLVCQHVLVPVVHELSISQWEHAYYLKHQNRRVDFVNGWWDVVNWAKVCSKAFRLQLV